MRSQRVGHNWATELNSTDWSKFDGWVGKFPWRRAWQFTPGESVQRSPWSCRVDTIEQPSTQVSTFRSCGARGLSRRIPNGCIIFIPCGYFLIYLSMLLYSSGFLRLGNINIGGQIIICNWFLIIKGCAMHYRIFSFPGFYPLDVKQCHPQPTPHQK